MNINPIKFKRNQQQNYRIVSVLNYGAFIASVEIYYTYQGQSYNFYNFNLAVLQEFRVNVPVEAVDVVLYAYAEDLFRGEYLLFRNEYPVADDACFLLWGLSFAAQYKEIPCTGPGIIQNLLPPAVCVPPQAMDNNCNCESSLKKERSNSVRKFSQTDDPNIKRCRVKSNDIYS